MPFSTPVKCYVEIALRLLAIVTLTVILGLEVMLHHPVLDLFDAVGYWTFRAALLIVFLTWLGRHVVYEVKAAVRELRKRN